MAGLGAIAQLGEHYNGIVEVAGSIPAGSTNPSLRLIQPTVDGGRLPRQPVDSPPKAAARSAAISSATASVPGIGLPARPYQ